ncbi:phosphonate ABC transporter, permease protein PhnE [Verticiella sediminum]|uniref:Phosphonate ABC transporter, permease protein PhnE n=1 Tax=Verticiella sediminum TaxID=1247510 RepID=A0A556AS43_9BURK|nr:phosphonate ABC transporter, permease protein PhnE [Verticiella sediminum]TSH95757.1 phosphonate ABC transporter, permease protein PhnE [Verticiella sediminum]
MNPPIPSRPAPPPAQWRKPPFIRSVRWRALLLLLVLAYLVAAFASISVDWTRVAQGLVRGWRFVAAFAEPDFVSRWREISEGLLESLAMAVAATALGVLLSIPVGLGAARNLSPLPVYLACRGFIAVTRAFPELIIAILLVKMFGFGPLAGMITLVIASMGFLGKLLAEEIETADRGQLEAVRATGARWPQWIVYAVQPQVMPRLIGLSLYRLDINFREAAIIGIVGAGGIGSTLNTAFDRYEFQTAAAILLLIIGIVMLCEYASGHVRRRFL